MTDKKEETIKLESVDKPVKTKSRKTKEDSAKVRKTGTKAKSKSEDGKVRRKRVSEEGKVKKNRKSDEETLKKKRKKSDSASESVRTDISDEEAMQILEENCEQAERILEDETKREDFLRLVEKKISRVPLVGGAFSYAPMMLSLIKSYVSGEYTNVSKRSIILIMSALFYFINVTDMIPDVIPIVGYIDDAAVFAVCLTIIKKELDKYKTWRK